MVFKLLESEEEGKEEEEKRRQQKINLKKMSVTKQS